MSLKKAIIHGKEKRKQYTKSKRFDPTCRNHGACSLCRDNRVHFDVRHRKAAEQDLNDFKRKEETE